MDDFYVRSAHRRLNSINSERLRLQQNLAVSLEHDDQDAAASEIQQIADLNAQQQNLMTLAHQENAKAQPAPAPRTDAWREKRLEEMTYEDCRRMINETSQYKLSVDEFNEGYQKALQSGWAPGRGTSDGRK
jgi:hypothetical protein